MKVNITNETVLLCTFLVLNIAKRSQNTYSDIGLVIIGSSTTGSNTGLAINGRNTPTGFASFQDINYKLL